MTPALARLYLVGFPASAPTVGVGEARRSSARSALTDFGSIWPGGGRSGTRLAVTAQRTEQSSAPTARMHVVSPARATSSRGWGNRGGRISAWDSTGRRVTRADSPDNFLSSCLLVAGAVAVADRRPRFCSLPNSVKNFFRLQWRSCGSSPGACEFLQPCTGCQLHPCPYSSRAPLGSGSGLS